MPARPTLLLLTPASAALCVTLAACSGGSVKQTVDVTVTSSACGLGSTTLDAGKTAFDVKNSSGKEAEAYVYTATGDKVDEVEGIADGTTRTLTVSLDAGKYEFACKPEGNDVRTAFTVR
jgi:iron uptake system component EfeO